MPPEKMIHLGTTASNSCEGNIKMEIWKQVERM
jgi:hypothetical protein